MSLETARQSLLNALTTGGVRAFYGFGEFAAPCARIFPADPWVAASADLGGKRVQRWEIWVIGGRIAGEPNYDQVEELVMQCNDAVEPMPGWGRIEWRRPAPTDMGGIRYFACRGTIETRAEA